MKRFEKGIAFVLLVCMIISLLPSIQFVQAAQTAQTEAISQMTNFSEYMLTRPEEDPNQSVEPEEGVRPSLQEQTEAILTMSDALFTSVREWLETE